MSKAQVKERFDKLGRVRRSMEQLKNLKIDWETDLEKIDFTMLKTKAHCDINSSTIEKINLELNSEYFCVDIHGFFDMGMFDLIDFIEAGNKIIPPLYCRHLQYNGENYSTKKMLETTGTNCNDPELCRHDGSHRLAISKYLGLKEIPIIVYAKILEYLFPINKWDFEFIDDSLIFKRKDGDDLFKFDVNKISINDAMFHENIIIAVSN